MIARFLQKTLQDRLFQGKLLLLTGPRQVGKTTLVRAIAEASGQPYLYLNADEIEVRTAFAPMSSRPLRAVLGDYPLVILDEAQRIADIGIKLKLLVDNYPDIQLIATGSSSLDLANSIHEPLTGRKLKFHLYPLSYAELVQATHSIAEQGMLEHRLIYGYYPAVVNRLGSEVETLRELTTSYLFKDVFNWEQIKKPPLVEKLLQALALQVGNEVSYRELGQLIGADNQTVERYMDLLEKSFVVFRLSALNRNARNEIKKGRKVYFYDNGIRNALISNFNPLHLRSDVGALWENFLLAERMKYLQYQLRYANQFFWRTLAQQEIDYVEEYGGYLHAYEFKWRAAGKGKLPRTFQEAYPAHTWEVISRENFVPFVGG